MSENINLNKNINLENLKDFKDNIDNVINSINKSVDLPIASSDTLGGVIVDGTTITANENGVISVIGGIGGNGVGSDYVLSVADENTLGGVMVDGSTISAKAGVISVEDNSHNHTIENVAGLQDALDGKADISAIPTSLPANGGNSDTVGGYTVKTNVPSNAKFTDTVYTLPAATSTVRGGITVGENIYLTGDKISIPTSTITNIISTTVSQKIVNYISAKGAIYQLGTITIPLTYTLPNDDIHIMVTMFKDQDMMEFPSTRSIIKSTKTQCTVLTDSSTVKKINLIITTND